MSTTTEEKQLKQRRFRTFLYNDHLIIPAVSFTLGFATNEFLKSLINNILMKVMEPLFNISFFQDKIYLGFIKLNIGKFLSSLVHYILVLVIIYYFIAFVKNIHKETLREDKEMKKRKKYDLNHTS